MKYILSKIISKPIAKYTIVGIGCTLFSLVSYPIIYFFWNDKTLSYILATTLNITFSYLLQTIITFSVSPSFLKFFRYIYVSLGLILVGNVSFFCFDFFCNDGVTAYYLSWTLTSLMSYIGHYAYTFKD